MEKNSPRAETLSHAHSPENLEARPGSFLAGPRRVAAPDSHTEWGLWESGDGTGHRRTPWSTGGIHSGVLGRVSTMVTHVCVSACYHNCRPPSDSLHLCCHVVLDGRRGRRAPGGWLHWLRPQKVEAVSGSYPRGAPPLSSSPTNVT